MSLHAFQLKLTTARRALTLLELVLSLTIVSVLLLGAQSAIMLATRALPDGRSKNSAIATASRALDQLTSDLSYATAVTLNTATEITFTVPDRNSDGAPEIIHYVWSGTPGAALTRQLNGGTAATIAADVQYFQLTYDKRSEALPATYTVGAETLLASYDPLLNLGDYRVQASNWVGETIKPSLPTGTSSWQVTRVKFKARTHGAANGASLVQIRSVGGNSPVVVLEEKTMLESSLTSSYTWQDFSFSTVTGLSPSAGIALTVQWVNDADACDIQYQSLLAAASSAWLATTSSGGFFWTMSSAQDIPYYLYGRISTPNATALLYRLTNVRCRLRTGSDSAGRINASVRILNEPQVAGP